MKLKVYVEIGTSFQTTQSLGTARKTLPTAQSLWHQKTAHNKLSTTQSLNTAHKGLPTSLRHQCKHIASSSLKRIGFCAM